MSFEPEVKNMDCMGAMKGFPDKFFDLAIVDPPYGLGELITTGGTWATKLTANDHKWDIKPNEEYFVELFRVSKNHIIWGGNYFTLPPTRGFIVWDKKLTDNWTLAMAEFAWTNFDKPSKIYRGLTDNSSRGIERIHICQKPIKLYSWLLHNYAKAGDKILDTHGGSMSSVIACLDMGFDVWCYEIDPDYYKAGKKRIQQYLSQNKLFDTHKEIKFNP